MGLIIGVTGKIAAGKDEVANYLMKKGFIHLSLSDILREDCKRLGLEVNRDNLTTLGSEVREKFGGSILAQRAIAKTDSEKKYVITSVGRVDEIKFLKTKHNCKIVFVDANQKKRFERLRDRKNEPSPGAYKTDFKKFLAQENKENKGGGGNNKFREFDNCKKVSDIILINNSTFEELHKKIDKILADTHDTHKRPDWDEYFFGIMDAVRQRATCNRGRAAAIIVRDKMVLATGYVGAPKGLSHCDEDGHIMEKVIHYDGVQRDHCVRTTHAEQNAIAQAAKHGIRIDEAKIYVNMEPCLHCTKMIINSGIKEIVCRKKYHAAGLSRKFLKSAGVKLVVKENIEEQYD